MTPRRDVFRASRPAHPCSALVLAVCAPLLAQEARPGEPNPPEPSPPAAIVQEPEAVAARDLQSPLPVDQEAVQKGQPSRTVTLGDALRLARTNNLNIRTAELLPQQARQQLLGAEAVFNPELYGNTGYNDSRSPQRNAFQPSVQRQTIDATVGWRQRVMSGGLFDLSYRPARLDTKSSLANAFPSTQFSSEVVMSFTQPLLRGAWSDYARADIDVAHQGVARSDQTYERSVQDTLLAVVQAYWDLVFARENYRIVQSALQVAEEQLRITLERIRVRILAPRDRVADDAEIARRQEELITAENAIRRGEDELRRLLFDDRDGQLWNWNLQPTEPIEISFEPVADDIGKLVDAAIVQRPDLKALRASVVEAEIDLMRANRDLLPDLDLVSTYSSDGVRTDGFRDAFDDSMDQQYPDWGLRLEFSIPIGNQAARSRQRQAELEVERRQRTLYGAMLDVTKEVREAVRNLDSLSQSIRASRESVRLAQTNLETEQVKLGVGSSTAFEVQRRNQELREARGRLLRNQLDYRKAQSRLLHAEGQLSAPRD